ncbi:hypothetical protein B0H15DRAFT_804096 [Mycena belliarum]|uniref:Uncharacterized protein n=1 Tax=Mycena belliarum TaxID=1033014 RepID=A0AAD6TV10_9AGAR|nr:hypothetical protein B0H15DRAFT_804096 [Mycena belliae]
MSDPLLAPFTASYTFGDLEHLLFPPLTDLSQSTPSPPQFCLYDEPLIAEQLSTFESLLGAPSYRPILRHRKTPRAAGCLQTWEQLENHIQCPLGWVAVYAFHIIILISILASDIWPESNCTNCSPSQSCSQQGACHIVFSIRHIIRTSSLLQQDIFEIATSMLILEGESEDWAGIAKKLGLHMGTAFMDLNKSNEGRITDPSASCRPLRARFFRTCVVAQYLLALLPPGFLPIPGVVVSHADPPPAGTGTIDTIYWPLCPSAPTWGRGSFGRWCYVWRQLLPR